MNGSLLVWRRNPKRTKPFPSTVENLCLKYLLTLARYLQTNMVGGKCNVTVLNHIITFNQNKEEAHCLKTQALRVEDDEESDDSSPPLPLKRKSQAAKDAVDLDKED